MKIIAVAAMSLDGFITRGSEPGTAFTSQADKDWFQLTMRDFPIKVFGRKTFEVSKDFIINQSRTDAASLRIVMTRDPASYDHLSHPKRLEFTDSQAADIVASLKQRNVENEKVAILGGGAVYSAFLNAGLLDEFWITLEPQLFGSGTPIATELSQATLALKESSQLGPSSLLLKYQCTKS